MISLRSIFFSWLALALSVSALEAASPKPGKPAKEKKFDPTTTLFATNALILTFQIEVAGGEWAALQKDNRAYARATERGHERGQFLQSTILCFEPWTVGRDPHCQLLELPPF